MTDQSRLMSGAVAAAYCGVTPATFSKWVAAGTVPAALPGTRRWDRKAIDLALDKASGIAVASPVPDGNAELEQWIRDAAARNDTAGATSPVRYHWEDRFDAAWAEWLVEHEGWKVTQPPSEHWSPGKIEDVRQKLWTVWRDLKGAQPAAEARKAAPRKPRR